MDDDYMNISFRKDDDVEEFLESLDLKEGNLYLVLRPEENGFQIVGADKIPTDIETGVVTNMYVLFAGLMHMATEQQELVMEAGSFAIEEELDRKERAKKKEKGANIVKFPRK
jgi:hypothetical protein